MGTTIIDALVVTLGLDPKAYKRGTAEARSDLKKTREEGQRTGKELEQGAKKSLQAFAELRREVLGLFAVFTGGMALKDFFEQTVQTDAAVGRLSKNLGVSTEELSAWEGVLKRSGGEAKDADSGLQALVSSFEQIQLTGQSPLIPYLQLLKVSLKDLNNPSETLLKIADAFQKMDPRQAAEIGRGMGLSPEMVSLLERGRTAVQAMLDEQKKIGTISQADAEAAQKLQNTLSSLHQAMTSIGRAILTTFAPALDIAGKVLTFVAELAEKNQPIVAGFFTAVAIAAVALTIPLAAVAVEALMSIAPFLLLGAAIGAVIEIVLAAIRWFSGFVQSHKEVRDAMAEVGAAAHELWTAIGEALSPLKPMLDAVLGVMRMIGSAIQDAFGDASLAVARTFVGFLTNSFHGLADMIRAVTALVHGDLRGAMSAAKDWARDTFANPARAPARPSGATAPAEGPAGPGGAAHAATGMIAQFEGFLSHAKWDRNAYRAGYGSDTTTDPQTGKVSKITSASTVTREAAQVDLERRVRTEFMPRVAAAVGAAWSRYSDATRAALTSVAYNYGSLPKDVRQAARSGNEGAIAKAIRDHASDNGGLNARRRRAEAAAIQSTALAANSNSPTPLARPANTNIPPAARGLAVGAPARYAANTSTTVSNYTSIDSMAVYTQATDANGIMRDASAAVRKNSFVPQANTGLS